MHFVLWGLHQPTQSSLGGCISRVSMHFVLWGLHQLLISTSTVDTTLFQCTSCFGVFINRKRQKGRCQMAKFQCTSCFGVFINISPAVSQEPTLSFNALRALGSSSTVWRQIPGSRNRFQCTSCFGVFINSIRRPTWPRCMFQCTSCFGVFINEARRRRPLSAGRFQCTSCFGVFINFNWLERVAVAQCFNALRALGSSSTQNCYSY